MYNSGKVDSDAVMDTVDTVLGASDVDEISENLEVDVDASVDDSEKVDDDVVTVFSAEVSGALDIVDRSVVIWNSVEVKLMI